MKLIIFLPEKSGRREKLPLMTVNVVRIVTKKTADVAEDHFAL